MKLKLNILSILLFVIVLFACKGNNTNEIKVFIQKYIETVSIEHEKYKTNITDKMVEYFYDDENKEKADMPEFLAKGGFRNNIIIVKNFEIQKIKKLPYKDIDGYSVNVQFIIYDKSKENEEYVKKNRLL